jgi:uncharacterized protein YjbI with pentapeptide repeats
MASVNAVPHPSPKPPRPTTVVPRALPPWVPGADDDGLESVELVGLDLADVDLEGQTVSGCALRRCTLDGDLGHARLVETVLEGCEAAHLRIARSSWRDVVVDACRLGSVEAYETEWRGVRLEGTKVDYLNARAATWRDVDLVGCRIGELDLTDARIERLRLDGCTLGTLVVGHARLTDVDLRGARVEVVEGLTGLRGSWLTPEQLTLLAPSLAAALGITIAE